MKRALFFLLVFNALYATAQNTDTTVQRLYRMNYWVSGTFCTVATAADIYAIPKIIKSKRDLTDAEIAALNPKAFNGLDRWALQQDPTQRKAYYKASDYVLPLTVVSAAALGFDKKIRQDWFRIFIMYYETHAITFSFYNFSPFGPAFQNKVRPVSHYSEWPYGERKTGNQRNSMYSGHSATVAASTFFMVKVYSDYHPEIGNKKYWLYGIATVPSLVEGYLRVKALAHFPSDVLIGTIIGSACGIAVPALHKVRSHVSVSAVPTPVGPGINIGWQPKYNHKKAFGLEMQTAVAN